MSVIAVLFVSRVQTMSFDVGSITEVFSVRVALDLFFWFVTYVLVEWNCGTSWENCRKQLNGDDFTGFIYCNVVCHAAV